MKFFLSQKKSGGFERKMDRATAMVVCGDEMLIARENAVITINRHGTILCEWVLPGVFGVARSLCGQTFVCGDKLGMISTKQTNKRRWTCEAKNQRSMAVDQDHLYVCDWFQECALVFRFDGTFCFRVDVVWRFWIANCSCSEILMFSTRKQSI